MKSLNQQTFVVESIDSFLEKNDRLILWSGIALYVGLFFLLCWKKYLALEYYDMDFASDLTVYWNSLQGRFLYFPFLEENIFGAHFYLIVLLVIPIFAIFQSALTPLFLQSLFLGMAAYPLYLLARTRLERGFSLTICFVYLLCPSLGFMNLFETHFDSYTIFFFFFALFFFEKARFGYFILFLILAASCKENVSLAVFMFGFYSLIRRRPWRWVLAPFAIGGAWFLIALKWIIPHFAKESRLYQDGFMFSVFYRHLGSNLAEIIKNVFSHPILTIRYALLGAKFFYPVILLSFVAFVPLFSPAVLVVALPIFAQNLLSSGWTHSQIHFQYVAEILPFVFAATVFGFNNLLKIPFFARKRLWVWAFFLACSLGSGVFLRAPQYHLPSYFKSYQESDWTRRMDRLMRLIPEDASVAATFRFLPKLYRHKDLFSFHFIATGKKMHTDSAYEPPGDLDYVLIDFNDYLMVGSFFTPESPGNIRRFLDSGSWGIFAAVNDVVLFKKVDQMPSRLVEPLASPPQPQRRLDVNFAGRILLEGLDLDSEYIQDAARFLRLTYYWRGLALEGEPVPMGVLLRFLDKNSIVAFEDAHSFGYRVYEPESWPKDATVKEDYYLFIPPDVKMGKYILQICLFDLRDGAVIFPLEQDSLSFQVDPLGRVFIGDVELGRRDQE